MGEAAARAGGPAVLGAWRVRTPDLRASAASALGRAVVEMETVQHAGSWEWEGVSRHILDGALVHGELGNHGPRRRSTAEETKAIRATQWEKMAQI